MDGGNLLVSFLDGTEDVIQETAGSGGGSAFMAFSHEPHKAVISDFLDAIEQGRDPAIPGEEALATQRVIDMIINQGV
jgi:predicted dehydrogenase